MASTFTPSKKNKLGNSWPKKCAGSRSCRRPHRANTSTAWPEPVRNSDATVPFTFQGCGGDQPNAFAFPGGFVFVYTGLIEATETEAELAGAMAHEIAHVAARHSPLAKPRAVRSQTMPPCCQSFGQRDRLLCRGGKAPRLGIPLGFLNFARSFESEADMLGIQYMYKSGYDPTASVDLFGADLSMEKASRELSPGCLTRIP